MGPCWFHFASYTYPPADHELTRSLCFPCLLYPGLSFPPSHTTSTPQVAGKAPIRTAEGCQAAAKFLGYTFAAVYESAGDHEYCLYADDGRDMVYFNKAPIALPKAPRSTYKSLCQSVDNVPGKSAGWGNVPLERGDTIKKFSDDIARLRADLRGENVQDKALVDKCALQKVPCEELFGPDWACCKDEKDWTRGTEPNQHTRCKGYWNDAREELNFQVGQQLHRFRHPLQCLLSPCSLPLFSPCRLLDHAHFDYTRQHTTEMRPALSCRLLSPRPATARNALPCCLLSPPLASSRLLSHLTQC